MSLSKLLNLLLPSSMSQTYILWPGRVERCWIVHCIFCALHLFVCVHFQGPKGENVGSITQPLPSSYLIFRAASESDGKFFIFICFPQIAPSVLVKKIGLLKKKKKVCKGKNGGSPCLRWCLLAVVRIGQQNTGAFHVPHWTSTFLAMCTEEGSRLIAGEKHHVSIC